MSEFVLFYVNETKQKVSRVLFFSKMELLTEDLTNYLTTFYSPASVFCMRFVNKTWSRTCSKPDFDSKTIRESFLHENKLDYYSIYEDLNPRYRPDRPLYALCGALEILKASMPVGEEDLEGYLSTMRWMLTRGITVDTEVCAMAACGGHLKVLQWARSVPFDWNWQTCVLALRNGHHEVYEWAKNNGCPYSRW